MFDTLFALFKKEFALNKVRNIAGSVDDILEYFEAQYLNDGNAKDAAIDAVVKILQAHKSTALPPVVAPTQPVVVASDAPIKS